MSDTCVQADHLDKAEVLIGNYFHRGYHKRFRSPLGKANTTAEKQFHQVQNDKCASFHWVDHFTTRVLHDTRSFHRVNR